MKQGKKPFVARDSIVAFNQLRQSMTFPLTEEQFKAGLKSCRIPYGIGFISELCRSELVTKTKDGYFQFNNPSEPIHFKVLQDIYQLYHTKIANNNREARKSQSWRKDKDKVIQAIKFLEERGFVVYMSTDKIMSL